MERRRFLLAAAALPGCARLTGMGIPLTVERPGMEEGHALRDAMAAPAPSGRLRCRVAVLGSGVAGLSAAWRLAREGQREVLVLSGPELHGNASAGRMQGSPHPKGAHYLALPTRESVHMREILQAAGVLLGDPRNPAPEFDERVIVHAPQERLWIEGEWREGLLPEGPRFAGESRERERFFARMEEFSRAVGADGRRAFSIPLALASTDPRWRALDAVDFAAWLDAEGFRAPGLRWYLDYVCRDEFGAAPGRVSAWIGIHYFAAHDGRAANAAPGALLTWPDGLNPLLRALAKGLTVLQGSALRVRERAGRVEVIAHISGRVVEILAERVVCALPLMVAARIVEGLGSELAAALPESAPWLVANFLMGRFPRESGSVPLAWDNVVYGSPALGFVVSTHQLIRSSRPEQCVFTAYRSFAEQDPAGARGWLARAAPSELHSSAAIDLAEIYGFQLWRDCRAISICARGHGMAIPGPGFLARRPVEALREADGPLLLAHSDLSGYSVFEEAAWWGWHAAERILAG